MFWLVNHLTLIKFKNFKVMRIAIDSIEANLIDASTLSGSDYIIKSWTTKYVVMFLRQNHTNVAGQIITDHAPTIDELIAHIKWLFEPMEERFRTEKIEFK